MLSVAFVVLVSGCGIDSTRAIDAPYAYTQQSSRYFFKHSYLKANAQGVLGYEILYRLYTNSDEMQKDYDLIEGYKVSLATGTYSKMIQTMGYQRITLQDFSKDLLVNLGEFDGPPGYQSILGSHDADIALDFTGGLSSVRLTIFDGVNAADSLPVYRGAVGTTANQGKDFDEIALSDSDVKNTSVQTTVFLQAYVFAIGIDELISYYYSVPSFLGNTGITCTVVP